MSESGWSLKFFHHHPTVFSKYLHHIWMVMCDRLKAPGRAHFSFIKVTALLTQTNSSYRFRSTFYKDNLSYLLVITCPVPPFGLFGSKLWETAPACGRPFPPHSHNGRMCPLLCHHLSTIKGHLFLNLHALTF